MRPRSRLLSKRALLLPTIREGTEETVRDLNEANTLHIGGHSQPVSSEDYLLSICHLAHPTFPSRDVSPDNIHKQQLDTVHQRLRLSRLSRTPSTTFNLREKTHAMDVRHGEEKEFNGELMFGSPDPLEYLYGHQNNLSGLSTCQSGGMRRALVEGRFIRHNGTTLDKQGRYRAHSIPHASDPGLPWQHKSSCLELHTRTNTPIPNNSPKHSQSGMETRRGSLTDGETEGERVNPTSKQSFISQWISDCRSAWREARMRACVLPAIAEI